LYDAALHIGSLEESISQWGTGFVIYRNETHAYVLTCAHVVRDLGGEKKVIVAGQHAEVAIYKEDIDVAVLKVQGVDGAEVPLRIRSRPGGRFSAAGFGKLGTNYRKMDLYGSFGRSDQLYARGKSTGHVVWELEVDGQETFEPGWSGSPVFDETNHCVGMVTLKQGPRGFAISIEVIRDV
jgi:S1-C subfamily serine protease